MHLVNFYESRHYKLFVLIPIALLLISIYFIPKIQLDSSLTGGTQIQMSAATNFSMTNFTLAVDSRFPHAQIQRSAINGITSLSVTIPSNASIASGYGYLLQIYGWDSNYSIAQSATAVFGTELGRNPSNASAKAGLVGANNNMTRALSSMDTLVSSELASLKPLVGSTAYRYNSSSASSIVGTGKKAYDNASVIYKNDIVSYLRRYIEFTTYSYNDVTPTLGAFFLTEVRNIIIIAFILVAIAVFFVFRTPLPSLALVFGAANDIIVALGAMGAFGIPLGVASIGGLLMLIGYSIDTELLSAIRILKRSEGTPAARAIGTMKTGVTMTSAAIISFTTLFIIAYVVFIPTYIEITGVVIFGLVADVFTTWFGNSIMILWYKEKRDKKWQR